MKVFFDTRDAAAPGRSRYDARRMAALEHNLAAMEPSLPRTAALIRAAQNAGFSPAAGTDGSQTWAREASRPGGGRRIEWLGGTSMPAASASAIVASLDAFSGGANGLGLSVGAGFEWAAFSRRLGRGQMIFVYEPDPAILRLALDLCDLSGPLAARRIVLLTGSPVDAGDELAAFLREHLGCEPPTVLHPLASLIGERRNQLLAAGEAIVRRTVTERHALIEKLTAELADAVALKPAPGGAVALLLTPRYAGERPIQAEARRRNAATLAIDTHDSTGIALRLQVLIDAAHRGTPTVLSDLFRASLPAVPPAFPVETWVPPVVGALFWERLPNPASLGPEDRVVVHNAVYAQRLRDHGIAGKHLILRPLSPSCRDATVLPPSAAGRSRVGLIADLPSTDAETLGITLPTHQAVFAAAVELIKADFLAAHPGMAQDILRRALIRASVDPQCDDPALRGPMLRIIRDVLLPAVPHLALAGALAAEGVPLLLIGDWQGVGGYIPSGRHSDPACLRHVSFAQYAAGDWQEAALLIALAPEGAVHPFLWDAVAAGAAVVAPQHRHDTTLAELLTPDAHYAHPTPQQLMPTVKALLRDAGRREILACAAAQRLSAFAPAKQSDSR